MDSRDRLDGMGPTDGAVTEAAALGAVPTFLFSLDRKKLNRSIFWDALSGTAVSSAMIYMIIIGANIMTYFATVIS